MNNLAKAELEFVGSITAPLFWSLRNSDGKEQIKNGSVFFLNTGNNLFGVTACHVVQECLRDTTSPMFVQSMVGTAGGPVLPIHLGDRIIDANARLDIATFEITLAEIAFTRRTALTGFEGSWPPRLPPRECAVTFGGFPGLGRRFLARRELVFGLVGMAGVATSVHEACISVQIERSNLVQVLGDKRMPENFDFGGISGCPLLKIVERNALRGWAPAGVVFQGPNPTADPAQSIEGFEVIGRVRCIL
jgi:hypothetical protein